MLADKFHCRYENGGERRFRLTEAEKNIRAQFGEEAFAKLPAGEPAAAMALGGLLNYLYETQKTDLSHIRELDYYQMCIRDRRTPAWSGNLGRSPGPSQSHAR